MIRKLTLSDIKTIAHALATELMSWNEPIPHFESRSPERLESCLHCPFQTYDSEDLYPTLQEKAAALFYLMVKNHPFQNGNKRIAVTTLFVFLNRNDKWLSVDEQELYNFAVWIAESPSTLKDESVLAATRFVQKHLIERT